MQKLKNDLEQNLDQNLASHLPKQSTWDLYLVLGSLGIFAIALFLRLWHLDYVAYPVFDEVYFPKYAEEYLQGVATWEGHPPLAKYLIMLGIIVFGHNEIGYRIASALFGAVVPILTIGVAYRLTYQRTFALLSGLFVLSDGLFLVESRLGLINVFLVVFGMASQIFLLAGLQQEDTTPRTFLLCCAGLMLGASASVKWNGLGFGLLLFLLILFIWAIAKFSPKHIRQTGILSELIKLHWWQYLLAFVIVPIAFYVLQWIPLLMLNSGGISLKTDFGAISSFWEALIRVHQHIIWWHSSSAVTTIDPTQPSHPYCSSAISWAVSARPIGYYFQNQNGYFSVIQALGNPILWWLSTLSIVIITGASLSSRFLKLTNPQITSPQSSYLLLGYFANYAPWLLVKRCLFIYHYMSAAVFSFMALAWLVTKMIDRQGITRYLGYAIIAIVMLAQIFFSPIWFGFPISPSDFYQRMWFMPDKVFGFNWI
ncbi:phospholipid carrier-dependent glycosyltransferase [Pseudanabaena biceps]|nr:phospholipid carrier-dependent glycosyltransferase [Pseudanabaena biceps]